jgi:hypothetical protein
MFSSFLTHQNQLYLKTRRPMLPPQQRRATHPQMAQHTLTGVWVKPSARLMMCEYGVPGTRNRFLSLDFMGTNTLTAME